MAPCSASAAADSSGSSPTTSAHISSGVRPGTAGESDAFGRGRGIGRKSLRGRGVAFQIWRPSSVARARHTRSGRPANTSGKRRGASTLIHERNASPF